MAHITSGNILIGDSPFTSRGGRTGLAYHASSGHRDTREVHIGKCSGPKSGSSDSELGVWATR